MRFALGFLTGVWWAFWGPGSVRVATYIYDHQIKRDRRQS
jgi:hypothetical protein